jgi:hypothetical protein
MTRTHLAAALFLLLNAAVPAALRAGDNGTAVSQSLVSEVTEPIVFGPAAPRPGQPGPRIAPALIVMAGAKVWSVIENGRPSAQLATAYASAIPAFSVNWDDLAGWKKVTRRYRYSVDSTLQGRAVDVLYEVSFCYGELAHEDGRKGGYIVNFTVRPVKIDLKWGWKLSMEAAMSDPMNVGTGARPVAWLNSNLKWNVSGPLKRPEVTVNSISVTGAGAMSDPGAQSVPVPEAPGEGRAAGVAWY